MEMPRERRGGGGAGQVMSGRQQIGIGRRPDLDDLFDVSLDELVHLRIGADPLGKKIKGTWEICASEDGRAANHSSPTSRADNNDAQRRQQIFRTRGQTSSKGVKNVDSLPPSKEIQQTSSNFASPESCLSTVASTPPSLGTQTLYDDHRIENSSISLSQQQQPNNYKAIDGTRNDRVNNFTFRQACIAAIKSPATYAADPTFPILGTWNRSKYNVDGGGGDAGKVLKTASGDMKKIGTLTRASSKKPIPDSSAARKLLRKYRAEAQASLSPSQLSDSNKTGKSRMTRVPSSASARKTEGDVPFSAGSSSPPPPCGRYGTIARSVYAAARLEQTYLQFAPVSDHRIMNHQVPPSTDAANAANFSSPLPSRRINYESQKSC